MDQMKYKQECAICETKIWEHNGKKFKKTGAYNETTVVLDNGSKMTVGVCSQHIKPDKLGLKLITEKVHKGWMEEVAFGMGNEAWVKNVGLKLNIVRLA